MSNVENDKVLIIKDFPK